MHGRGLKVACCGRYPGSGNPPSAPIGGAFRVPKHRKELMTLTGVLDALLAEAGDRTLRAVMTEATDRAARELDLTAPTSLRPFVVAGLASRAGRPDLAVTATGREAEDLVAALQCLLSPYAVAEYPAWETLPHERLSPRSDTVGRRLAVLRRLVHPEEGGDGTGPLQV